jgi:hypothetical protein
MIYMVHKLLRLISAVIQNVLLMPPKMVFSKYMTYQMNNLYLMEEFLKQIMIMLLKYYLIKIIPN